MEKVSFFLLWKIEEEPLWFSKKIVYRRIRSATEVVAFTSIHPAIVDIAPPPNYFRKSRKLWPSRHKKPIDSAAEGWLLKK